MTIKTFCRGFNQYIALIAVAIMVALVPVPSHAQQTVDPVVNTVCGLNSSETNIVGQTGTYTCISVPGSATGKGVWRKNNQMSMRVAYAMYNFAADGGAIATITPAVNSNIPANAVIVGAVINPTTAVTSLGSATVSIGTSAGSSTTSIVGATAKASLSLDALVAATPVFTAATSFKMTAAGSITFTVAVAALTAGVIEVFVFYVVPANA